MEVGRQRPEGKDQKSDRSEQSDPSDPTDRSDALVPAMAVRLKEH
jgi:hypothetical protein